MRYAVLFLAVLTFGCTREEGRIRTGKAMQVINALGAPKSAEIIFFGEDGWSDWAAINEEHRAKLLKLFSECFVVRVHYNGSLPQFPPANWVVRFKFANEPERSVEFLLRRRDTLISVDNCDSADFLDCSEQHEELVELLELLEK